MRTGKKIWLTLTIMGSIALLISMHWYDGGEQSSLYSLLRDGILGSHDVMQALNATLEHRSIASAILIQLFAFVVVSLLLIGTGILLIYLFKDFKSTLPKVALLMNFCIIEFGARQTVAYFAIFAAICFIIWIDEIVHSK